LSPIANSPSNGAMPRRRPQHLVREFSRHGKPVWYCRRGGRRIRLRAEYGTPEFEAEFQTALNGGTKPEPQRDDRQPGTVAWLISHYRETTVWQQDLSAATRRQRDNIFLHVIKNVGDLPVTAITREKVIEARNKRAVKTPHQARNFLDALRGLFRWALDAGHAGVTNPKRKSGDGFAPWAEDDVLAYERRWPIGTQQRVWLDGLLYTGLRRGDAVRLGRQHVRDGVATLQTEKSRPARAAISPSFVERPANRSQRNRSAIFWLRRAAMPASRASRRMAFARSQRRVPRTQVPRSPSWKQSSAGAEGAWHRFTPARRTAVA
jgi:integrase